MFGKDVKNGELPDFCLEFVFFLVAGLHEGTVRCAAIDWKDIIGILRHGASRDRFNRTGNRS